MNFFRFPFIACLIIYLFIRISIEIEDLRLEYDDRYIAPNNAYHFLLGTRRSHSKVNLSYAYYRHVSYIAMIKRKSSPVPERKPN